MIMLSINQSNNNNYLMLYIYIYIGYGKHAGRNSTPASGKGKLINDS